MPPPKDLWNPPPLNFCRGRLTQGRGAVLPGLTGTQDLWLGVDFFFFNILAGTLLFLVPANRHILMCPDKFFVLQLPYIKMSVFSTHAKVYN